MAGGFGGFLAGLGVQAGYADLYGQQFQQNQAKTQLMQADAEKDKLQASQMQQQMQTQKSLGAFIQSQTQLDGADAANPLKQAQMYNKAAGLAASQGDFASAQEMTTLAKNATQDAQEAVVSQAKQQQVKKEDLANTADEYSANPTRDGAMALAKKAIAAGVNPASIPANLNSPEGQAWVNQQKLAGMDSKAKAEFVQKAADIKANRDMKWQEHEDTVSLRQAQMQQTAAFREDSLALRASEDAVRNADRADKAKNPQVIDIGGTKWERDPDMKLKGERNPTDPTLVKLGDKPRTATQENNIVAIGGAAAESARNLTQMARFPTGTANSPFAHITDHTFLDSITKTGSNALTPEQIQMFQTSSSGLSTELSRVMTLGGGRGANQSVINEVKAQITPTAGDTNLEAAYKLSTGAQIVLTRMNSTPDPADPSVKKQWDATKAQLQAFPTPETILNASSGSQKKTLSNLQGSYHDLLNKVQDTALPGTPDAGAGPKLPPLPAGFKVDQ